MTCPSSPHCDGDPASASPGHGHLPSCQHPKPFDGDPGVLEFEAMMQKADVLRPAMVLAILYGAARLEANEEQRHRLDEVHEMLKTEASLKEVGQAILDAMGPMWVPSKEIMDAMIATRGEDRT